MPPSATHWLTGSVGADVAFEAGADVFEAGADVFEVGADVFEPLRAGTQ